MTISKTRLMRSYYPTLTLQLRHPEQEDGQRYICHQPFLPTPIWRIVWCCSCIKIANAWFYCWRWKSSYDLKLFCCCILYSIFDKLLLPSVIQDMVRLITGKTPKQIMQIFPLFRQWNDHLDFDNQLHYVKDLASMGICKIHIPNFERCRTVLILLPMTGAVRNFLVPPPDRFLVPPDQIVQFQSRVIPQTALAFVLIVNDLCKFKVSVIFLQVIHPFQNLDKRKGFTKEKDLLDRGIIYCRNIL